MIGNRDPRSTRRGGHGHHATDVPRQRRGLAVAEDFEALLTRGIAVGDEGRAIGQPLTMTAAAIVRPPLLDRTFPQAEGERLAAHVHGHAVARRMDVEALHEFRGGGEASRCLRAVTRDADIDRLRLAGVGVEAPDLCAALVDDARAIGLRVPRVVVVVIRVTREVAAIRLARVDVADTFGVRQEVHALADPHRARDVALQFRHPAIGARTLRVDPQVARRAAAIALPARRIRRVAADHARAAGAEGQVIHLAQRERLRQAAGRVDRVRAIVAEERLALGGDEHDVAFARPAAHHHVRTQVGQASRRAAFGRHHVHLRVLLVAAGVGNPFAVGRETRRGRFAQAGGETPRRAAGGGHAPQVVVADKDNGVARQRGLAQVALIAHRNGSRQNMKWDPRNRARAASCGAA